MKLLARLLLLFACAAVIALLIVSRCCNDVTATLTAVAASPAGAQHDAAMLRGDAELQQLRHQVAAVRAQLAAANAVIANNSVRHQTPTVLTPDADTSMVGLKNEYEMMPYVRFTSTRFYSLDPGLGRRVVEKPIAHRKREIAEVIEYAAKSLNRNQSGSQRYTADDFVEGVYRTVPAGETQYELFFAQHGTGGYRQVVLSRPFSTLRVDAIRHRSSHTDLIHLVLPLSGRIAIFAQFLTRFIGTAVKRDGRVALTVVYFGGGESLVRVRQLVQRAGKRHRKTTMRVLAAAGPFSRGRGLQLGAVSWKQTTDVLLFLCDVDVVFTPSFLDRCRLNARAGHSVYYPVVFSLYNPRVIQQVSGRSKPASSQLVISKDTGFWRDFGYGMTCLYRSDFSAVGGFEDDRTRGWGLEDVHLYRKYIQSSLSVIRAPDPGLFHLWHDKECPSALPADQYDGCMRSRALNEASHAQLGLLVFRHQMSRRNRTHMMPTLHPNPPA